ncbi:MAG: hypothetical protein HY719_06060 [Planctomycetes bacterium]|nr:hypothetical protein [Planctomycetota bacterium]
MTAHPLDVAFAGLPCVTARFDLRAGLAPSTGEVTIAGAAAATAPPAAGDLLLGDGRTRVTLRDLIVTRVEMEEDGAGGALTRLSLADRRLLWRAGAVTGRFNVAREDGVTFDPATLDHGSLWRWHALVTRCLAALGPTSREHLNARVPPLDVPVRNLVWTLTPAREALAHLLALAGATLRLAPDGAVEVLDPAALAAPHAPVSGTLLSRRRVSEAPRAARPGAVVVRGARIRREQEVAGDWEPVALSDGALATVPDGALAPLAALLAAWGIAEEVARRACLVERGFDRVATGADEATRRRRADILTRCAWRWYRLPAEFRSRLPMWPTRLAAGEDGRSLPIRVKHTFFRRRDGALPAGADPFENVAEPRESPLPFTVDLAAGVVRFDEVVGLLDAPTEPITDLKLEGRSLAAPAALAVTFAFELPGDREEDLFQYVHRVENGGEGGAIVIAAPDLALAQTLSASDVATDLNRAELDARARALALAEVAAWTAPERSEEVWAGALPMAPARPEEIVSWEAGPRGLVTRRLVEPRRVAPAFPAAAAPASSPASRMHDAAGAAPVRHAHISAFAAGPVIVRAAQGADPAEAVSFAEALSRDASGARALRTGNPGPWRYPFFAPREAAGQYGGWHDSLLVKVAGSSGANLTVIDADLAGAPASGATLLTGRPASGMALFLNDLALLKETHAGDRALIPLTPPRLTADHFHDDGAAANRSTPVRRVAGEGAGLLASAGEAGDLDDLFVVTRDPADPERFRLALFLDDPGVSGATETNPRMLGVAGGESSGSPYGRLGDVVHFLNSDRRDNDTPTMGIWASAYFSATADSPFQGRLQFDVAPSENPLVHYASVAHFDIPRIGGRLVWDPDAGEWEVRTPLPLTTGESSGAAASVVARGLGADAPFGRFDDLFTIRDGPGRTRLDLLASCAVNARGSPFVGPVRFNCSASAGALPSRPALGEMLFDGQTWRPALAAAAPGQFFVVQPGGAVGAYTSGSFIAHRYLASSHAGLGASGAMAGADLFNVGHLGNILSSGDIVFARRVAGKWMSNVLPGIVGAAAGG